MNSTSILKPRRTLGLVGITIHAMTLIAPGAFIWLLFPLQLSAAQMGQAGAPMSNILPGVLLALLTAFLTAVAFSGLARRYPEAGNYSAYHFAQRVFGDLPSSRMSRWTRPMKFLTGWAAHLFYWVYPGVMIAFLTTLLDYLLRQFGYQPTPFGQVLLAVSLASFVGFLALRGITGSMASSILLNVLQISALVIFSGLAILFRVINPAELGSADWFVTTPSTVFLPQDFNNVLVQAALSILLVVGFESIVSSGVAAANPHRDVSRGVILTLIVQGFFAYVLQYFAFQFALSPRAFEHLVGGMSASPAPLGDLAVLIGDRILMNNGFALMIVIAATVMIAGLAASLTSINTGVRITFAMAVDAEMPGFLSLVHERHATPYTAVIVLTIVSALVGSFGVVGGRLMLLGITLAANLGAFLLYALICAMAFIVYAGSPVQFSRAARFFTVLGVILNLSLAGVIGWVAIQGQGLMAQAAWIALGLALLWLVASFSYYFLPRHTQ